MTSNEEILRRLFARSTDNAELIRRVTDEPPASVGIGVGKGVDLDVPCFGVERESDGSFTTLRSIKQTWTVVAIDDAAVALNSLEGGYVVSRSLDRWNVERRDDGKFAFQLPGAALIFEGANIQEVELRDGVPIIPESVKRGTPVYPAPLQPEPVDFRATVRPGTSKARPSGSRTTTATGDLDRLGKLHRAALRIIHLIDSRVIVDDEIAGIIQQTLSEVLEEWKQVSALLHRIGVEQGWLCELRQPSIARVWVRPQAAAGAHLAFFGWMFRTFRPDLRVDAGDEPEELRTPWQPVTVVPDAWPFEIPEIRLELQSEMEWLRQSLSGRKAAEPGRRRQNVAQETGFGPWKIVREATKRVPAVKYALGIAGIVAALALIRSLGMDWRVAGFGSVVMLVLMTVLVVFAKLSVAKSNVFRWPAALLLWTAVLIVCLTAGLLFTSVWFEWPVRLQHWLSGTKTASATPSDADVELRVLTAQSWKLPPDRLYRSLDFELRATNYSELSVPIDPEATLVITHGRKDHVDIPLEVTSHSVERGAILEPRRPVSLFFGGQLVEDHVTLLDKGYSAYIECRFDRALASEARTFVTTAFEFSRHVISMQGD